ncbi:hypothetical protein [Georgenia alba]|uniref:Uncharacterized protein n=1 Tax=Georgenia alba TaxID=2233858 RepID=A0ABW2Q5F8_9MICO
MSVPGGSQVGPGRGRRPVVVVAAVVAVVVVVAVVLTVLLPDTYRGVADLADRVATHGDARRGLVAVDLAAVREDLGVPEDVDLFGPLPADDDDAWRAYFSSVAVAIPHVPQIAPDDVDPAIEAIDLGAVMAAATTTRFIPGSLTVLRTEQPFEEIAAGFTDGDYERAGDTLSYVGDGRIGLHASYSHLAYRDGLLALTSDPEADVSRVQDAVGQGGKGGELVELAAEQLEETAAAYVEAEPGGGPPGCVDSLVVGDSFTGTAQVTFIGAGVQPALDQRPGIAEAFDVGEPQVDGDRTVVELTESQPGTGLLAQWFELTNVWSCE